MSKSNVSNSQGTAVHLKLDPMTKARLEWIKANLPTVTPSNSLLMRRAVAHYVRYLESEIMVAPELIDKEQTMMKAETGGQSTPWKTLPDFAQHPGKPLSQWIAEGYRQGIQNLLKSSPFPSPIRHPANQLTDTTEE